MILGFASRVIAVFHTSWGKICLHLPLRDEAANQRAEFGIEGRLVSCYLVFSNHPGKES